MVDQAYLSLSHSGTAGIAGPANERTLEYRDVGTVVAAPLLDWDLGSRAEDGNVKPGPIQPLRGYLLVDVTTEAKRVGIAGLTAITVNVWQRAQELARFLHGWVIWVLSCCSNLSFFRSAVLGLTGLSHLSLLMASVPQA